MKSHYQILIIGGGIWRNNDSSLNCYVKTKIWILLLLNPKETHYYQPAWTLVGAGAYDYHKTAKPMKEVIPKGTTWIQDFAISFDPSNNSVNTKSCGHITYDYLVVAPGLVMEPNMIEGLEDALNKGIVCSNYTDPEHTWEIIKNFKGGNAIFTQPTTPIKCVWRATEDSIPRSRLFQKKRIKYKNQCCFRHSWISYFWSTTYSRDSYESNRAIWYSFQTLLCSC